MTRMHLLFGAALALGTTPLTAQTTITADTNPGFNTGTTVTQVANQTVISNGTRSGNNLFHSFNQFDLASGDGALWLDGTANAATTFAIINRVTGGDPSDINGTISVGDMPDAAFYFINPAGVFFGPDSAVNVPNAAYFSTAEEIALFDGGRFSTVTPDGSTFSIEQPSSFGFLGGQANIAVVGVDSGFFSPDGLLNLSGANVIVDDSQFEAQFLDFTAVGNSITDVPLFELPGPQAGGAVLFVNNNPFDLTQLTANGSRISGEAVIFDNALLSFESENVPGEGVAIASQFFTMTNGGAIFSTTRGAANASNITIAADTVDLLGGTLFSSTTGPGDSGVITINANQSFRAFNTNIASFTVGPGSAGMVSISANQALIADSQFDVQADAGSTGNSGALVVEIADSLTVRGSRLSSSGLGSGDAGFVAISAPTINLSESSRLSSTSFNSGAGGLVAISTGSLSLDQSAILSGSQGSGDAGAIVIDNGVNGNFGPGEITLRNDSAISSFTQANGNAGFVQLTIGSINLDDGSVINSQTELGSSGLAGQVRIEANALTMDGRSTISSATAGSGDAGIVAISVGNLAVNDGSITSSTVADGNAGLVGIEAGNITVGPLGNIVSTAAMNATGDAGAVVIEVSDSLNIQSGTLRAATFGPGDSGVVSINAQELIMDGGEISSFTTGSGNAGLVEIEADRLDLTNAIIDSQAEFGSTGAAGNVVISANTSIVLNTTRISSSTDGDGNAGGVVLVAPELIAREGTQITSATTAEGNAGVVAISAEQTTLDASDITSFSDGGGNAGSIALVSEDLRLVNGAVIDTETTGVSLGDAGDIEIITQRLTANDSTIRAVSAGQGEAGSITIGANVIELQEGAAINTNSRLGPAGTITLNFAEVDGDFAAGRLLLGGERPAVITTTSGTNSGGQITIASPYLILSDGGSILALGQQTGADVLISSDFFIRSADRPNLVSVNGSLVLDSQISDLSTGTEAPDVDFLDASAVLSGQCAAARASGQTSGFTSRVTGPYAPISNDEPDAEEAPPVAMTHNLVPCG